MNINHERLVPGAITYWGDVVGDINDQQDLVDYIASHGGGGGGNATWGSIQGTLSNQTDLNNRLTDIDGLAQDAYNVAKDTSNYLDDHIAANDIAFAEAFTRISALEQGGGGGGVTPEEFNEHKAQNTAEFQIVDNRLSALEQNPGVSQQDFDAHAVQNDVAFKEAFDRIYALEQVGGGVSQQDFDEHAAQNAEDFQNVDDRLSALEQGTVTLDTNQEITGEKIFSSIITDNISGLNDDTYAGFMNLDFNAEKLNISTTKLNIQCLETGFYNGKFIATTDDCIKNRTYYDYGPFIKDSEVNPSYMNYTNSFRTHDGRVFVCQGWNVYEIDGQNYSMVQIGYNNTSNPVYNCTNNTFYVDGAGQTYMWDSQNSTFNYICTCPEGFSDRRDYFVCGGTLRYRNIRKLVDDGQGNWSWESSPINYYVRGKSLEVNGVPYIFGEDQQIVTYDDSTDTYTVVASYYSGMEYTNAFTFNGELFFTSDSCVNKVDILNGYCDQTDIWFLGSEYFYTEYDSHMYTYDGNTGAFGYVYGMEEETPEVPDTDGTYVLKATVLNGEVSYEWVPDNVL